MNNLQTRLDAATTKRYACIARMEDSHHRMEIATRAGDGPDPADLRAFETARDTVQAVDVELRELQAEAREMLGDGAALRLDVGAASGMDGLHGMPAMPGHARTFGTPGRVDCAPLWRALQASGNRTAGRVVCKTLLQGVGVGQLGRTTMEAPLVTAGGYGANPLVLSVQGIPVTGGILHWNRVEANAPPALGPATAEGAAKTNVVLKSTPGQLDPADVCRLRKSLGAKPG